MARGYDTHVSARLCPLCRYRRAKTVRVPSGPWSGPWVLSSCSLPWRLAPADITRTAAELKAARTNYAFKVTDKKVARTDSRCLVTTPRPGVGGAGSTLCLSDEGAVLLVEGAGNPLRAERYSTSV